MLGLGAAGAIWLSMGDRQGLEEVKQGVQGVEGRHQRGQPPGGSAAAGAAAQAVKRRPPPRTPTTAPATQPNPAVDGHGRGARRGQTGTARGQTASAAATAVPVSRRQTPPEAGTAGKRAIPPRTKPGWPRTCASGTTSPRPGTSARTRLLAVTARNVRIRPRRPDHPAGADPGPAAGHPAARQEARTGRTAKQDPAEPGDVADPRLIGQPRG